ncbi:MAG: hypothetical protein VYD70_09310 [Planctomycetota bacterium]|nr:hypothetical protein [Planctomycetota bacterium]
MFAVLISLLSTAASCCLSNAPDADRHFYRDSARETVRYFRYAIDAQQHNTAYQCLTPSAQQQISPLAFEALIRFVDVPELGGVGLKTLLMESHVAKDEEAVASDPNGRWITLIWTTDDQYIEYSLLLSRDSSGIWWIDLLSTRGVDLGSPS